MKQSAPETAPLVCDNQIYFVGSGVPNNSMRGTDWLNRMQSITARHSFASKWVYIYIYTSYIAGLSTNVPGVALLWPLVDTKVLCFQHHTAGCLNVMFSTKVLIVAAECWEETWETDCVPYCVSKSQKCIVIFIKVRIFKFVLMTVCCNIFTIILFC